MTEIFTIISCFYFFGPGTAVPNHCSPHFYDSAFQSMEACEKKRKESFVYDDKRIPRAKGSIMETPGADAWNICVPKAEFERHLRRDKFGNVFCLAAEKEPDDPRKLDVKELCAATAEPRL
jgi:hypothetical protein